MVDSEKSVSERLIKLSKIVLKGEKDARKFDNGNTSAGIRLRKHLQRIRLECKNIRADMQMVREIRRGIQNETGKKRRKPKEALKVRWSSDRRKKK